MCSRATVFIVVQVLALQILERVVVQIYILKSTGSRTNLFILYDNFYLRLGNKKKIDSNK